MHAGTHVDMPYISACHHTHHKGIEFAILEAMLVIALVILAGRFLLSPVLPVMSMCWKQREPTRPLYWSARLTRLCPPYVWSALCDSITRTFPYTPVDITGNTATSYWKPVQPSQSLRHLRQVSRSVWRC